MLEYEQILFEDMRLIAQVTWCRQHDILHQKQVLHSVQVIHHLIGPSVKALLA